MKEELFTFSLKAIDAWANGEGWWEWNEAHIIAEKSVTNGMTVGEAEAWFHSVLDIERTPKGCEWRDGGMKMPHNNASWEVLELCDMKTGRPLYAVCLE